MKKFLSFFALVILIVPTMILLSGCGSDNNGDNNCNHQEVGYWETQAVDHIYTEAELAEMAFDGLESFKNKYIKFECTVTLISMRNNLYYTNLLHSTISSDFLGTLRIYAYSYQNYWDIPYNVGDVVYVEGYMSSLEDEYYYNQATIYINPCIITKK